MGPRAVVDVEVGDAERVKTPMQRRRRLRNAHLLRIEAPAMRASRLAVAGSELDLDAAQVRREVHGVVRPPPRLLDWPWWLVTVHTGDLFAYPVGGGNFGSLITTLLCLAGLVHFWKARCWSVLGLCLYCLLVLKDTPWRSGKGDFASIPARHRKDEPPLPEVEEETDPPVVDAEQPKEDAE